LGFAPTRAARRLKCSPFASCQWSFAFNTVRSVVLTRFPDLVRRSFPTCPAGEEAFAYALELYLRAIPNLDTAVDGWRMLRLVRENATSLQAVGIMHVLPTGELPLEVELSREPALTRYRLRMGIGDARWDALSHSKRWKAVYLYASGERDEEWTWSEPVSGCLADPQLVERLGSYITGVGPRNCDGDGV
jgi:hypothetical protein